MELPFKDSGYRFKDEYAKKTAGVKSEKTMKADAIFNILQTKLKAKGFVTASERNYIGYNKNPFDLVAGDEDKLTIIGFEIKADTDSYTRLTSQLDSYMFACEHVYLVVHKKKIPEWLPREIGVIRVFNSEEVFIERYSFAQERLDISTLYEWDALFKANGLGASSKKTRALLNVLESARKNILFNRFFASYESYDNKKFVRYYPFSQEEKKVLIGMDIPYHFKKFSGDLRELENRLAMLRNLISLGMSTGIKGLDSFKKKKGA